MYISYTLVSSSLDCTVLNKDNHLWPDTPALASFSGSLLLSGMRAWERVPDFVGAAGLGAAMHTPAGPRRAAAQKILMNFELFTSQFQTDYTCNSTRPDCDLAFALASLRARNARRSCLWALPHFMHCWKDGWCRFKEFRKYLLRKFVAMHLPHSVKRHHVEYGSNNAWVISYKHHTLFCKNDW